MTTHLGAVKVTARLISLKLFKDIALMWPSTVASSVRRFQARINTEEGNLRCKDNRAERLMADAKN